MLKMMGFPGEYIQGTHALAHIGEIAAKHDFKHLSIIYDPATEGHILQKVTNSLDQNGITFHRFKFNGECTYATIEQLYQNIAEHPSDAMIALGGGKALDTAKGVSKQLNLPIIICPTIASSDAPTSRLIIVYDENHQVQTVEKTRRNPDIVLVDLDTIVHAPARFFAAGIGDAISKMFEASQCKKSGGLNSFSTPPLNTALLLAESTYSNLISYGKAAYEDVQKQKISPAVERVVESTVLISGLGFESGGLSLAHALIRGLTAVPEFAGKLHGELVAYGTVVQALLENRDHEFMLQLIHFLRSVNLPTNTTEMGYTQTLSDEMLDTITELTLQNAYSKHFEPPLTQQALKQALLQADLFK